MERMNLCSSAIKSFRESQLRQGISNQDKAFFGWLCETLAAAHKFILPDGGRLIADVDVIKNADLLRLPYPVTALEYRVQESGGRVLMPGEIGSNERIALCISPSSPVLDGFRENMEMPEKGDEDGFYVISIFRIDDFWTMVPLASFMDTSPAVGAASPEMRQYLKDAQGLRKFSNKAVYAPFFILPSDFFSATVSDDTGARWR